jgi:hypothetical protein
MLIQEKRAEVDLEGLWGSHLERKTGNNRRISGSRSGGTLDAVGLAPEMTVVAPSDPDLRTTYSPRTTNPEQRRGIHTNSRPKTCNSSSGFYRFAPLTTQSTSRQISSDPEVCEQEGSAIIPTSKSFNSTPTVPSLFQYLFGLPKEEARHALGQGPHDISSTPFLRLFHQSLGDTSSNMSIFHKLELAHTAVMLQHPNYSKSHLFETFQEFAAAGGHISKTRALHILKALLSFQSGDLSADKAMLRVPSPDIELALKVLDHLSLQGMKILTKDVFILLYKAVGFHVPVRIKEITESPNSIQVDRSIAIPPAEWNDVRRLQRRLNRAMVSSGVQFGLDEFPTLLRIRFNHADFDKFWSLWRKISLYGIRRSPEFYTLLFQLHAERGNQRLALECLSSSVPMMGREDPPVALSGELARAVMACILVADPNIRESVQQDAVGPLPVLWKECLDILVAEKGSQQ